MGRNLKDWYPENDVQAFIFLLGMISAKMYSGKEDGGSSEKY